MFCFELDFEIGNSEILHLSDKIDRIGNIFKNKSLLIVDDNPSSRDILSKMASSLGLKNDVVSSGAEAIGALDNSNYNIVLMDWKMPQLDGIETAIEIKSSQKIVNKPKIIIVTAFAREDILGKVKEANLDGFLLKPVSPSSMMDSFMQVLGIDSSMYETNKRVDIVLNSIQGAKILLVEDNEINREFAVEMLKSEGFIVVCANDGFEAIEKIKADRFDMVLMDIQMPKLDGIEATKRIRMLGELFREPYYENVPIVALSANVLRDDIEKAYEAGMSDYVSKPFAPNELFEILLKWIPTKNINNLIQKQKVIKVTNSFDSLKEYNIDVDVALSRAMGNEKLYFSLLEKFVTKYSDGFDLVIDAINSSDLIMAEQEVHKIKGLCGNLGAMKLFDLLQDIDLTLKKGIVPNIDKIDEIKNLYNQTINGIKSFLIGEKVGNIGNLKTNVDIIEILKKLGANLETDISVSLDCFEKLQNSQIGIEKLGELKNALESFDLEKAKLCVDSLLKEV